MENFSFMSHTVEIKEYRRLQDGQIAVAACCCGDPTHTSWHTMGPAVVGDPSRFESSVAWHVQRVANQHETTLQAKATLSSLVGQAHVFDSKSKPTKHSVKFEHYKQVSDGQLLVESRCCGDDSTRSQHIVDSSAAADPIICQATLKEHFQKVANQHETMQQCSATLPGLIGKEVKIDTTANASAVPVATAVTATPQQVGAA
jgi:hypothetical protein